eukprot:gene9387-11532_t
MDTKIVKVGIIIGSTRSNRLGGQISKWYQNILNSFDTGSIKIESELIDLIEWNLPMFDEPAPPKAKPSEKELIQKWGNYISGFNGFVFVTPQYNWSIPGSLKNAIDYLYNQWTEKPCTIISYGYHGGVKATEHLNVILGGSIKMKMTAEKPAIYITKEMFSPENVFINIDKDFEPFNESVKKSIQELTQLF